MSLTSRVAPRLRSLRQSVPSSARSFTATTLSRKAEEWPQAFPVGKFYEHMVNDPIPYPWNKKPEEPPNSADPQVLPEGKEPAPVKGSAAAPAAESSSSSTTADERPAKRKPGRKPKNATVSNTRTTEDASASHSSSFPPPPPSAANSPPSPSPPPATAEEKARVVFGTRLAGPGDQAKRIALKKNESTLVAGVLVPPLPEEPDNCCMSGCVNCVWETYREDMEEYSAKRAKAEERLAQHAGSMDADGGGSETNWEPPPQGVNLTDNKIAKDLWEDDVFKDVPVGIREFMKQEKRLKEKHEREGSVGG